MICCNYKIRIDYQEKIATEWDLLEVNLYLSQSTLASENSFVWLHASSRT